MSTDTQSPKLLKVGDAADYMGVGKTTLRGWSKKGLIPVLRVGPRHDRRYSVKDLDDFLQAYQPKK